MRIFVVGGAGYVGSHCVRRLVQGGHDVVVFDNLIAGHRAAVAPAARLITGDLADRRAIDTALESAGPFDAAMHFAAFLDVGESVRAPLKYWHNNVAGTLNLLASMECYGVRRFIFSSTCAVYGEPQTLPIVESLPKSPINPYGRTKLAVEQMLEDSAAAWGLGSVALRYFNASGAAADATIGEDHEPEIHLIPLVLKVALGQRESIKIFGTDYPTPDGTCIRDYVHVEDLAEAHLRAVERCEPGRAEAYNVGTGRGTSVREIIEACRRVTGHPIPTVETPRRPGDPPALYANADAIGARLGWQPRYRDIEETIATAWRWHSTHPAGFGDRR
ncbi:MAG: UDP-glucose 4-epimerase GalE [Phycisphaerales bacterium]|nr:UDP-glucose 4-epimerase GalE [Phycisphaerales bacterium]